MDIFGVRGSYFKDPSSTGSSSITVADWPDGSKAIATDIRVSLREKTSVVECFGGVNYVFAMGHNPVNSVASVSATIFLQSDGSCDNFSAGSGLKDLYEKYKTNRISNTRADVTISLPGGLSLSGGLVEMDVVTADPETNTMTGTLIVQIYEIS